MPKLHIVCLRPGGMHRGGARHEGHQMHELEAFTPAQLREMQAEPHLALIVGGEKLDDRHVATAEKAAEAKKKPAAEA